MPRRRRSLEGPILDAAADLFLTEGYVGTHMARVAAEADVSLATLYRYFESKDDLLDQAFRREVDLVESPMAQIARVDPEAPDALKRYASVIRTHTLRWATADRALGLLLVMAETPGLLYRFFLDKVEVHEHWLAHSVGGLLPDSRWITTHSVVSASGFYALMIRWARGRLREGKPDLPRHVPAALPDANRPFHVPRECDFTAEELAEWYTTLRLRGYGVPETQIEELLDESRAPESPIGLTGA
jgi:AcrR family transcriptional regulator